MGETSFTRKKVTFLGTDAHRSTWRPPAVKDGIRYILENCEKEYAERILFQNAQEMLGVYATEEEAHAGIERRIS